MKSTHSKEEQTTSVTHWLVCIFWFFFLLFMFQLFSSSSSFSKNWEMNKKIDIGINRICNRIGKRCKWQQNWKLSSYSPKSSVFLRLNFDLFSSRKIEKSQYIYLMDIMPYTRGIKPSEMSDQQPVLGIPLIQPFRIHPNEWKKSNATIADVYFLFDSTATRGSEHRLYWLYYSDITDAAFLELLQHFYRK